MKRLDSRLIRSKWLISTKNLILESDILLVTFQISDCGASTIDIASTLADVEKAREFRHTARLCAAVKPKPFQKKSGF